MKFIDNDTYNQVINHVPIFCVDVIIENVQGQYLLIKRKNEPLKGHWWVIGGRVLKAERCRDAAIRKIKQEVSLDLNLLHPVGYYELISGKHPFGIDVPYHAVSIVFKTVADTKQKIILDEQSTEWKYADKLPDDFIVNSFGV